MRRPLVWLHPFIFFLVFIFSQSAYAQNQNGLAEIKYLAIKAGANNNYSIEQFSSAAAIGTAQPEAVSAADFGGLPLRALTATGDTWYGVLRGNNANCFVTYTSYANVLAARSATQVCTQNASDGYRGIAYDGKLFYSVFRDGSRHWWQSYQSWNDLAFNRPYSQQTDIRNPDIYKAIGFDPVRQTFYSLAQKDQSLYVFEYATFNDMVAVRAGVAQQVFNTGAQYAGMVVAPVNPTLDVYIVAGQSNAVGWDTDGSWLPTSADDANIRFFYRIGNLLDSNSSTAGTASSTLGPQIAAYRGGPATNFGIEMGLGRSLYDAGRRNIAIVKVAFGGTSLYSDWNPLNLQGLSQILQANLAQATTQWNQAGFRTRIAGFFWMQGEADAQGNDTTMADAYQANLTRFIATVRAGAADPSLPFVFGRITTFWPYNVQVRAAQQAVAAADPLTALVNTDDLPLQAGDSAHFTNDGEYTLGQRMAQAFRQLAGW